jgi:hypothetical protein
MEFIDVNYWGKLSAEEKHWLSRFLGSYYRGRDWMEGAENEAARNAYRRDIFNRLDRVPFGEAYGHSRVCGRNKKPELL